MIRQSMRLAAIALALLGLAPSRPDAAELMTAETVFRRANEQFSSLQDYECVAETDCRVGGKAETAAFRLWYKQPGMFRVRVLRGRQRGSEVAFSQDGKIRARKGGILKPIVVRLNKDDDRLYNLRGVCITEFVWSTFYHRFRERASLPGARTALLPRKDSASPYEVLLTYAHRGKNMRELYRVDPRSWIMLEGQVYEAGSRVDHVLFREIRTNTGVKESWFRL